MPSICQVLFIHVLYFNKIFEDIQLKEIDGLCMVSKKGYHRPHVPIQPGRGCRVANIQLLFPSFPKCFKRALLCLGGGWAAIYCFAYWIAIAPKTMLLLVAIGLIGCFSLIKGNEWARRLIIAGNMVIMMSFLFFAAALWKTRIDLTVLSLIIVMVFGVASYFLLKPETSAFFKAIHSQQADGTRS